MAVHTPLTRTFLALALALLVASALPSAVLAETRPHYHMDVHVQHDEGVLEVDQRITFRNNTGAALPELVFQVTSAYFDAFTLRSAQVDGRNVQASLNGTVLELPLDLSVPADATAEVRLSYRLDVPPISGRFGRGEGIMALGQWYPVLAVHRDDWDRYQYVDVGDAFYAEVADFDVVINSAEPLMVAATGWLSGWEPGRQSFRAEGVREFGMAISRDYEVDARLVDGVAIMAYGLSAHRLPVYLDAAERMVRWYSAKFGEYAYPFLTIAEIHDTRSVPIAQEFPGLIFVNSALGSDGGGPGSYSEYLLGHEIAHQWFYAKVGNDQVHDPWLDEAMATYADMLYYRDQLPWAFDHYWGRNLAGYRTRVASSGDRPVNTDVYDYPDDLHYFDMVYRQGAMFLHELRELLGDEAFYGLIRDYVRTYSGKIATPRAFLDMAYTRGGDAVPALIDRYFTYGAFLGGNAYRLEVSWPERLPASGFAHLSYRAGFPVVQERVWLDNRLLYEGYGGGNAILPLEGIEEGEYVLRLDLIDNEGALYQRATRVAVGP